jgi:hypothetical protein
MEWVLNNLQILFLVAIAVVAIMQRLKKATGEADSRPAAPADPDEEARTRRIQEEIRRRIMERRGLVPAGAPAAENAPVPMAPPMIEEVRPIRMEYPATAAAETPADRRLAAELKRQQELNDQVRELVDARRMRQTAVATESARTALAASAARPLPDLRSHAGLRRAILLREILGPPVGLR